MVMTLPPGVSGIPYYKPFWNCHVIFLKLSSGWTLVVSLCHITSVCRSRCMITRSVHQAYLGDRTNWAGLSIHHHWGRGFNFIPSSRKHSSVLSLLNSRLALTSQSSQVSQGAGPGKVVSHFCHSSLKSLALGCATGHQVLQAGSQLVLQAKPGVKSHVMCSACL